MKLGELDIIGDPADYAGERVRLTIKIADGAPSVELNDEQTERLITYLKGLRDGMGWNKKSAADRSL